MLVVTWTHVAEFLVSPLWGFLFILDPFSDRSLGGLHGGVPPGLPATRI
jgi:hypothetical protein